MANKDLFADILRIARFVLSASALILATICIFNVIIGGKAIMSTAYFYLEVGILMSLGFLTMPATKQGKIEWYDGVLVAVVLMATIYAFVHAEDVENFSWMTRPPLTGFILATAFCFMAVEACRRAGGPFFAGLVAFFLFYPMFSGYMPGFMWAPTSSFHETISFQFFGSGGIFGILTHVLCYILLAFIVFASAIKVFGGGEFFINLAQSLLGTQRGGAAKVSVLSSAFMASISGSTAANVVTTGAVTIPAMKGTGYSAEEAGAIESCASAGGCVMPPVMGAAGFVMAQFLGIHYAEVCIAAFVPAILFFAILLFGVDVLAVRGGQKGLPRAQLPRFWPVLLRGWYYLLAIFILVYFLFFVRAAMTGAFYAAGMLLVFIMFSEAFRHNYKAILTLVIKFVEDVGGIMAYLTCLLAPIGIVIGALFYTGAGTSLSVAIERAAGGNLFILLVLAAMASFVLGMGGVGITANYVILAVLIAPSVVSAGNVYPLSAHLFLLFCALWAVITPPIAVNCFAASSISGGDPMKTAFQALRLGIPLFIVPFLLAYNTELSFSSTVGAMVIAFVISALSLIFISSGAFGFFYKVARLSIVARVCLVISGLAMIPPDPMIRYSGLALAIATLLVSWLVGGRLGSIPSPVQRYTGWNRYRHM